MNQGYGQHGTGSSNSQWGQAAANNPAAPYGPGNDGQQPSHLWGQPSPAAPYGTPAFVPVGQDEGRRTTVRKLGTAMLALSIVIVLIRIIGPSIFLIGAVIGGGLAGSGSTDPDAGLAVMGLGGIAYALLSLFGLLLVLILMVVAIIAAVKADGKARIAAIAVAAAPLIFWILGFVIGIILGVIQGVEPGSAMAMGSSILQLVVSLVLALLFAVVVIGGSVVVRGWGKQKHA